MSFYQQNTSEWLELRRSKIGASDACVIMGVSPWLTPYALWEEKVGMRKSRAPTSSMQRGNRLEAEARDAFIEMTGIPVMDKVVFHPEHNWMMASLDGIDPDGKQIVEIKCPGDDDHDMAENGHLPPKYYPQLQHQMEVTGLNLAYYFSYDGTNGVVLTVHRNQNYIEDMLKKEKAFYNCMVNLEPPKLSDKDYLEKNDSEWMNIASSWMSCQEQINQLQEQEEALRGRLINLSNDRNCFGGGVKLSKCTRRGSVDYNSIPALEGIDLNEYRKPDSSYWRISKS